MNLFSRFKKNIYQIFYWLILPKSKRHLMNLLPTLNIKSDAKDSTIKTIFFRKKEVTKTLPFSNLKKLFDDYQYCFLVGEGQSIQNIYFQKNTPGFFIGTNAAIEIAKQHDIHFNLYIMVDPDFINRRFDIVKDVARRKIPCVLNAPAIKAICEKDAALLKKMTVFLVEEINKQFTEKMLAPKQLVEWLQRQPNITLHQQLTHIGFCADIRKGVFDGGIELFWALQIAYFIGFREMAFLGLDLAKEELKFQPENHYTQIIKPSFELVRNLSKKGALKVTNLSLESRLPAEILPKMTYEQFLSNRMNVV